MQGDELGIGSSGAVAPAQVGGLAGAIAGAADVVASPTDEEGEEEEKEKEVAANDGALQTGQAQDQLPNQEESEVQPCPQVESAVTVANTVCCDEGARGTEVTTTAGTAESATNDTAPQRAEESVAASSEEAECTEASGRVAEPTEDLPEAQPTVAAEAAAVECESSAEAADGDSLALAREDGEEVHLAANVAATAEDASEASAPAEATAGSAFVAAGEGDSAEEQGSSHACATAAEQPDTEVARTAPHDAIAPARASEATEEAEASTASAAAELLEAIVKGGTAADAATAATVATVATAATADTEPATAVPPSESAWPAATVVGQLVGPASADAGGYPQQAVAPPLIASEGWPQAATAPLVVAEVFPQAFAAAPVPSQAWPQASVVSIVGADGATDTWPEAAIVVEEAFPATQSAWPEAQQGLAPPSPAGSSTSMGVPPEKSAAGLRGLIAQLTEELAEEVRRREAEEAELEARALEKKRVLEELEEQRKKRKNAKSAAEAAARTLESTEREHADLAKNHKELKAEVERQEEEVVRLREEAKVRSGTGREWARDGPEKDELVKTKLSIAEAHDTLAQMKQQLALNREGLRRQLADVLAENARLRAGKWTASSSGPSGP